MSQKKSNVFLLRDIYCGDIEDLQCDKLNNFNRNIDFHYDGKSFKEMNQDELDFLAIVLECDDLVDDEGSIFIPNGRKIEVEYNTPEKLIVKLTLVNDDKLTITAS